MLSVFAAAMSLAHRRGIRAACACFGSDSDDLIGKVTIVRTLLLLTLSVAVLTHGPGASPLGNLQTFVAATLTIPILLLVLSVLRLVGDLAEATTLLGKPRTEEP